MLLGISFRMTFLEKEDWIHDFLMVVIIWKKKKNNEELSSGLCGLIIKAQSKNVGIRNC